MLKELAFQKGWAGITISRAETIERLNPIIREHMIVNRSYDSVIASTADAEAKKTLNDLQRIARANVGKIAETIYSCGGVAFNGTDLEPSNFALGSGKQALDKLREMDEDLIELVEKESAIEHQMRTRAILGVVKESTEQRIVALRDLMKDAR